MTLHDVITIHGYGTATSGCDPAVAEAHGTHCGRPPKDDVGWPPGYDYYLEQESKKWSVAEREVYEKRQKTVREARREARKDFVPLPDTWGEGSSERGGWVKGDKYWKLRSERGHFDDSRTVGERPGRFD
jgi:hypothetical protein